MNDLNADAAVITDFIYTNATTYSIPLSAMPTGTYEIQVQAIDGWNATSPFSEPYLLTIESNPKMRLPLSVCALLGIGTEENRYSIRTMVKKYSMR